jgi:hypothetical protein
VPNRTEQNRTRESSGNKKERKKMKLKRKITTD